jgi:hypothetical protein
MPTTMQLIAKQTVGAGGVASVTFSSIPQTFTDLKVLISARDTVDNQASIRFNSSTTGYSNIRLQGTGSVAQSTTDSSTSKGIIAYGVNQTSSRPANTFGNSEVYIPNYAGSTNKSFSSDGVEENNGTTAYSKLFAGLLSNTAAITSITLSAEGIFEELSEFTLYGISNSTTTQNPTTPSAIGGDVITTDGTYWYHTFLYSGTFTPLKALTCDYLVVAGGAGGGGGVANTYQAGGGGAGGMRCTVTATGGSGSLETGLSLISGTAYVATVGSGGAGGPGGSNTYGTNGANSIFATITSLGGGGGGSGENGQNGGSGGGAGINTKTFGTGNSSQGFNGGSAFSTNNTAGGGGGASAVGQSAPNDTNGGAGGAGRATSISGSSITYAGGGGGGVWANARTGGLGGTGGGGAGGSQSNGTNGTANLGGGGGGAAATSGSGYAGGNGGSGIIVVRYAV